MTIENKEQGYIKLYRSMFTWDWWDDVNTFRLFVTILFLANWEDRKWRGQKIKRGSFWTSLDSLSKRSGLTVQQTRTSLNKLISTNEITIKSTKRGRLITVTNYDLYQGNDETSTNTLTNSPTNKQQTSNKQATITNKYKNIKNNKKGSLQDGDDFLQSVIDGEA